MKTPVYFDIETEALPFDQIEQFKPEFEAPGNYKDTTKIEEWKKGAFSAWLDKCALSPLTGRIVALGMECNGEFIINSEPDETFILKQFWGITKGASENGELVGFNIFHFDLPFMIRRSLKLGVQVPFGILPLCRYWEHGFVDLMSYWKAGDKRELISLDKFAKFLGVGQKNGEGKHFSALLKEDRAKAIEYLQNDLRLVRRIHERITLAAA